MSNRTDRAGFPRTWGMNVYWQRGVPWFSLGVHLDWHTPTVDFHIGQGHVQIGRNMWDGRRLTVVTDVGSGHTDQCLCWNQAK